MRALDRRFVYDLQKGRRKSMIALTAFFASQGSLHYRKKYSCSFLSSELCSYFGSTYQIRLILFKCSENIIRQ